VNPHPALGDQLIDPPPVPYDGADFGPRHSARARAEARWGLVRRPRPIATWVADCQLYGLGVATSAAIFLWPSWWAVIGMVAAWVVPAVVGAWFATRRRQPAYRSLIIDLQLDRSKRR
jgi:hypothetical protein